MAWPPYSKARPLAVAHRGSSPLFHRLVAEVAALRLPLFPYPLEVPPGGSLRGAFLSGPLGLRWDGLGRGPAPAQGGAPRGRGGGGRPGGPGGARPLGALRPLHRGAGPGAPPFRPLSRGQGLWLGPLRPSLAPFLRALGQVSVVAPSFAEGEGFLVHLPPRARGHVALRREEGAALASRPTSSSTPGAGFLWTGSNPFTPSSPSPPWKGVWPSGRTRFTAPRRFWASGCGLSSRPWGIKYPAAAKAAAGAPKEPSPGPGSGTSCCETKVRALSFPRSPPGRAPPGSRRGLGCRGFFPGATPPTTPGSPPP